METLICLKSQAIPSFNQFTHFGAVNAAEETHWQGTTRVLQLPVYKLAQEQQTLCTAESTNSRLLDSTRWNS